GGISFADPLREGRKTSSLNRAAKAALVFCFPHLVRASSSHLLQNKTPAKLGFSDEVLRRERDSNPRKCYLQRFSRPPQSTALPSLRRKNRVAHPHFRTFA